jgi:hypothetical protein
MSAPTCNYEAFIIVNVLSSTQEEYSQRSRYCGKCIAANPRYRNQKLTRTGPLDVLYLDSSRATRDEDVNPGEQCPGGSLREA